MPVRVWTVPVPSTAPATLIVGGNAGRTELFITNNDPLISIFLGPAPGVTALIGYPLYAKESNNRHRGFQIWLGPVYAISASGTVDVRVWETYDVPFNQIVGIGIDSGGNNNIPSFLMYDDSGNIMYDDSGNPIYAE